jgi:hypothetical protein
MQIVCIKIPENNPELFEINRKYNAYYMPSLGFAEKKSDPSFLGYWIDDIQYCEKGDNKIFCQVSKENFVTIDEWRELQLNKILERK